MRRPLHLAFLLAALLACPTTAMAQDGEPPATNPAPAEDQPAEPSPAGDEPAEEEHPTEETHPTEEPAPADEPAPTPAADDGLEIPPDPADSQPPLEKVPEARPLPDEPRGGPRKAIEKALAAYFGAIGTIQEGAVQQEALADLYKALQEWREDEDGNDPLRSVDWWKATVIENALPIDNPDGGKGLKKYDWKTPWGDTVPLVYSTPRNYNGKRDAPWPVVITVLPPADFKGYKKSLERLYGDALDTHLVIGLSTDFVGNDHRRAMFGVVFAFLNLKTDRHRYVIDGVGEGAATAAYLAADYAMQFGGAVLRQPAAQGMLDPNYGLLQVLAVSPEAATQPVQEALTVLREHADDLTLVETLDGEEGTGKLAAWLGARTPRGYGVEGATYTWYAETEGQPQVEGYWFQLGQLVARADDIDVRVTYRVDREHNLVDLVCENVKELVLLLNDKVVDLDHPVEVRVNGIQVTRAKASRSIETMLHWMANRHRTFMAPAYLPVTIPNEAVKTREQREAEARLKAEQERRARENEESGGTVAPDGDGSGEGEGGGAADGE